MRVFVDAQSARLAGLALSCLFGICSEAAGQRLPWHDPDRPTCTSEGGPGCLVTATTPKLSKPIDNGGGVAFQIPNFAPGRGGGRGKPAAPPPADANSQATPCKGDGNPDNINPTGGHPVIISTGEKIKTETDFEGGGLYPFGLSRGYHGFSTHTGTMFGSKWTSSYDYHLTPIGSDCVSPAPVSGPACYPHTFRLDTPEASYTYTRVGSKPTRGPYKVYNSEAMGSINIDDTGLYIATLGSTTFEFDTSGRVLDLTDASGVSLGFNYTGGNLTSVTGVANQVINFAWSGGHVTQVTDPRGQVWGYGYTPAGMLQTVTSPDSHVTTYGYDATHANWLNAITVDGTKVLAVTYYANGQVATSGTPDGEEVDNFSYSAGSTTLTDQRGDATTYSFQSVQGGLKLASVSHAGTSTCTAMAARTVYDANGWVDYTVDWRGTKTDYTYSTDGRLLDKTVGFGTPTPIKDVYTWTTLADGHYMVLSDALYGTDGSLVRTTTYGYDQQRDLVTSVDVKDAGTGSHAITSYGYTFSSNFGMQSRTETRSLPTGASTTTYNYDTSGNLASVVDPSGATVSYGSYDGLGRPGSMVTASGISHAMTYDGRGNLATDTAYLSNGTAISRYSYDGRNNLVGMTLPDGSSRSFTIAQSGRVSAQTDAAGNPATETFGNALTKVESQGRAVASSLGGDQFVYLGRSEFHRATGFSRADDRRSG